MPDEMRLCLRCESNCVAIEGDYVEPLTHPDRCQPEGYWMQWYECMDCGHLWTEKPQYEPKEQT